MTKNLVNDMKYCEKYYNNFRGEDAPLIKQQRKDNSSFKNKKQRQRKKATRLALAFLVYQKRLPHNFIRYLLKPQLKSALKQSRVPFPILFPHLSLVLNKLDVYPDLNMVYVYHTTKPDFKGEHARFELTISIDIIKSITIRHTGTPRVYIGNSQKYDLYEFPLVKSGKNRYKIDINYSKLTYHNFYDTHYISITDKDNLINVHALHVFINYKNRTNFIYGKID